MIKSNSPTCPRFSIRAVFLLSSVLVLISFTGPSRAAADEASIDHSHRATLPNLIAHPSTALSPGDSFTGAGLSAHPRGGPSLCPTNSLFSQPPTIGEGFSAGVSEVGAGIIRADRFRGVSGAITSIRWWGFELDFIPPNTFVLCTEPDPTFDITIYQDYGSAPGPVACAYTMTATRTPSGLFYGGEDNPIELIQYDVTLPTSCFLVRGYLSIVGRGDSECWFYWMSSSVGDDSAHCTGCQLPSTTDLAFCLNGTPGGFTGSCCDELAASCEDNVDVTNCVADYQRFTPDTPCSALSPACGQLKGSCCFDDGRPCSNIQQFFCEAVGGAWAGPGSPCSACPPVGPCCQGATICVITTEAGCLIEGLTWLGEGAVCADCPPLPECDSGTTLYGQGVFDVIDEPSFNSSEGSSPFQVYDNYTGVNGTILSLTWWGIDMEPVGFGFIECDETINDFTISFYEDAGGQPGSLIRHEFVTATRTPTNIRYNGAELNEYKAQLLDPLVLPTGWVSIVGLGDPTCWFLWMRSPDGDDMAFCSGCVPQPQSSDFAFCLEGTTGAVNGACCDQAAGVCTENVDISQCLGADHRFAANGNCGSFSPPCGVFIGACCQPFDTCTIGTEAECGVQGGSWIGNGTICSQCPCIVACPPSATAEDEAACGPGFIDTTNGGCGSSPPVFAPISFGQSICGTAGHYPSAAGDLHDQDWFELTVNGPVGIAWNIAGEGAVSGWIFQVDEGCPGILRDSGSTIACQTLPLFWFADGPGTYWLVVSSTGLTDASACPMRYTATLESPFGCTPGDVNQDLMVNGVDLGHFVECLVSGSSPGGNCACADMNFSGGVTMDDVQPFVAALLGQ